MGLFLIWSGILFGNNSDDCSFRVTAGKIEKRQIIAIIAEKKGNELNIYCTCAILTCILYPFSHFLKSKNVSRGFCLKILVLCMVGIQERFLIKSKSIMLQIASYLCQNQNINLNKNKYLHLKNDFTPLHKRSPVVGYYNNATLCYCPYSTPC